MDPATKTPTTAGVATGNGVCRSLDGLHGTVGVPRAQAGFWRNYRAFVGPAFLVSVGYMDPGNWGTDLEGGARFRYGLLWVVALSSAMAIVMQILAARLGVVTGKDLAQACRDYYPAWTRWPNWLCCEIAIAACDLAEVLGSAVALNLLFHIPLFWAVVITAFDVLLLLALQGFGMRLIEAVIVVLVATIGGCYFAEIFVLPLVAPDFLAMGASLVQPMLTEEMLPTAIGIVGATVMPHNLYLHSALVHSRRLGADPDLKRRAIRFNTLDTVLALSVAFLVNAAILVLAAMQFHGKDGVRVPGGEAVCYNEQAKSFYDPNTGTMLNVELDETTGLYRDPQTNEHIASFRDEPDWIKVAYLTLTPLLGKSLASILFAVALLASGQSSTITGTLAGQVVMEGFMHWRISPWMRRMVTRLVAIVPAVVIIGIQGDRTRVTDLLVLSQVILAMQLPLAMFPLLHFTSSGKRMGMFKSGWFLLVTGWGSCLLITALDLYGMPQAAAKAWAVITGG